MDWLDRPGFAPRGRAPSALIAAGLALTLAACGSAKRSSGGGEDTGSAAGSIAPASAAPTQVAAVGGLEAPEAIVYDSAQDVYFVSNVNGTPGVKDGNGFISKIGPNGQMIELQFIGNGQHGVTLNGPMGSRVRGDTLWVLDIDKLHAFDTRTGKRLTTIDFAPLRAKFLNDLAFAPSGAVYVTDMGMQAQGNGGPQHVGPDRILEYGADRGRRVALEDSSLSWPDGIVWDRSAGRLIITPFGGKSVLAWKPGQPRLTKLASGAGKFDGIEREADGTILLTSWDEHALLRLDRDALVKLVTGLDSPSDVTIDTRRHRVAISLMGPGQVQIWTLPETSAAAGEGKDTATARAGRRH